MLVIKIDSVGDDAGEYESNIVLTICEYCKCIVDSDSRFCMKCGKMFKNLKMARGSLEIMEVHGNG